MNYLLDANTLIEAKNRYYRMATCPGYWDWLLHAHARGLIGSVDSVARELRKGNDDLADWAKAHSAMFEPESDEATQHAFAEVAKHVALQAATMKPGALEEFLAGADPWLIAKARTTGAVVVTQEQLKPDAKRKFLIPNVCQHFGVEWIDTFDLLTRLEARFILER
jgi:hypothetical protein